MGQKAEDDVPFPEKWHTLDQLCGHIKILTKVINGVAVYVPLFIFSFKMLQPHKLVDAEKFNITYSDPSLLVSTADKLRYYRYKKALRQRDVADYAGIDRSTYNSYEQDERDYYPIEPLSKIAEVLAVDMSDLLDDYNMFLYNGQGEKIKELRKSMKLTQFEFAKLHGVNRRTIEQWEHEKVQIFKSTWVKLFK